MTPTDPQPGDVPIFVAPHDDAMENVSVSMRIHDCPWAYRWDREIGGYVVYVPQGTSTSKIVAVKALLKDDVRPLPNPYLEELFEINDTCQKVRERVYERSTVESLQPEISILGIQIQRLTRLLIEREKDVSNQ